MCINVIINNAGDVTVVAFYKLVSFTGVITVADVTRYAAVGITTSFAVNILIILLEYLLLLQWYV